MTTAIGLALLFVYATVIVVKTVRLGRTPQASPGEYFLAGRRLGPWVHMMTITASFFSMYSFAGAYGITWRIGINFLNQGWWMLMFLSWTGVVIGGRLWLLGRRFGFVTPADLMAHYYGSELVRGLVTLLGLLILFPYAAIQFSGVGRMIESFSGGAVPYGAGVGLFLAFTAAYTLVSGMRGVAWTDLIQGAMFAVVMFAALAWVFIELGGPWGVLAQVQERRPDLFDFDQGFGWFLNLSVTWGLGFAVLPHVWQRWYAAESLTTVYRSSWVVGVVSWALCLPIFFIGLSGHLLLPDLTAADSDSLLTLLLTRHLPLLAALVVPAAFAAAMSTVDSMLLSLASSVENDVVARVVPGLSPRRRTAAGKAFVIAFALLLVGFALTSAGRDFIVPLGNASATLALVLLPPLAGPLFWPRGTTAGAVSALVAGGLFMLVSAIPAAREALLPAAGLLSHTAIAGLLLGAAVFGGVSLVTPAPPPERGEAYHGYLARNLR